MHFFDIYSCCQFPEIMRLLKFEVNYGKLFLGFFFFGKFGGKKLPNFPKLLIFKFSKIQKSQNFEIYKISNFPKFSLFKTQFSKLNKFSKISIFTSNFRSRNVLKFSKIFRPNIVLKKFSKISQPSATFRQQTCIFSTFIHVVNFLKKKS